MQDIKVSPFWLIAQREEIETNYWYNFRHSRQHKEKLGLHNGQMMIHAS